MGITAQRRFAAILCADVVGYSKMMGADEDGTFRRMQLLRTDVVEPAAQRNNGRLVKTTGDGFLLEFESAVNSVRCALDIQSDMGARQSSPADRTALRIGVNLGDVIHEAGDIFGDGVNVAARLEALAEPGTVYISSAVFEQVRGRIKLEHDYLGEKEVKNIARPVAVYRVRPGPGYCASPMPVPASPSSVPSRATSERLSIVVLPFAFASNDPDSGLFAEAVTEDIITDLSRISGAFVISSSTTFTYRNRTVDPRHVATELNVRYVLTGTVRRAGEQVRVTATLVDGNSGAQIWAERFDRTRGDLFSFQDEVTGRISRSLNLELKEAASRKAMRGAPEGPGATGSSGSIFRRRHLEQDGTLFPPGRTAVSRQVRTLSQGRRPPRLRNTGYLPISRKIAPAIFTWIPLNELRI